MAALVALESANFSGLWGSSRFHGHFSFRLLDRVDNFALRLSRLSATAI